MPKSKVSIKRRGKAKEYISKKTKTKQTIAKFYKRFEKEKELSDIEKDRREKEGLPEETSREREERVALYWSDFDAVRKYRRKGTEESDEQTKARYEEVYSELKERWEKEDEYVQTQKDAIDKHNKKMNSGEEE